MMAKIPAWRLLVDKGIVKDRKAATSWIMTGKVLASGQRIDKAGQMIPEDVDIRVKGLNRKYASRGGLKLEGALADFGMDVMGIVAMDAGASTGGFTDCLLQHGAARVYAVDAGYGQLRGKLRVDARVVNMERVNISDLSPDDLIPRPVLATVDLSYLSLKKAIPVVSRLVDPAGQMLCLVKPLFEVEDETVRRKGIIDDPALYTQVLSDLISFVDDLGLSTAGVTHSHIRGNKGTREFFLRILQDKRATGSDMDLDIPAAVERALRL